MRDKVRDVIRAWRQHARFLGLRQLQADAKIERHGIDLVRAQSGDDAGIPPADADRFYALLAPAFAQRDLLGHE